MSDDPNGGSANQGGSSGHTNAGTGAGAHAGNGGTHTGTAGNGTAGQAQGGGGSANDGGGDAGAGGTPDDPGESEPPFCSGTTADLIDISKTQFMDYGKLRVGFKQKVDATMLSLRLVPTGQLKTTALTQVDDTTVDVTLAYYHLPRDYQIQVAVTMNGVQSSCGSATLPGDNNGARVGFLTKATGPGNFKSWPSASAGSATPRDAADSVCQSEAEKAGFKGTFVAFLSAHGAYDAACRALGLDGTVATNCGQSTLPVDHAPFLNALGLPMVDGATDLAASNWNTSIVYTADGTSQLNSNDDIWTGSIAGAVAGTENTDDCAGWTSQSGNGRSFGFVSQNLPTYGTLFTGDDDDCVGSRDVGLMCLQVGSTFFAPNTLHLLTGKHAFVTKGTLTGAMSFGGKTGVAAADALCQSEADDNGLANAPNFRAYVGTAAIDPMCHVLGKAAKTAEKCGLGAWPTDVWSRTDGYPIGSADDLVNSHLIGPILLAADKSKQFNVRPWTTASVASDTTCQDWTSDSASIKSETGDTAYIDSGWYRYVSTSCDAKQPVYCFEQ